MATVAQLEVAVIADTSGLQSGLRQAELGATSILSSLRTTFSRLPPLAVTAAAGIGAAFVGIVGAIGKVAFDAAEEFDKAYDHIRVATGAVGADAAKLQESFRNVFTSIPTTAEAAAQAIGFLSARLGLTGTDLENLAKQELEFARITGTSLTEALNSTSRLFKDFQDSVKNPADALDFLFKVSQKTGTELTKVASSLVAYGAPLRGLGFDFEQAAVLTAKFTAEGVELGKVLPGMRQALANLAKEGVENAGEAFRLLIERIAALPTQAEQTAAAIEVFGKRAGPDLAEAIRQGRFSIDELIASVKDSEETILKAAQDTRDYGESWTVLKNNVMAALAPMGEEIRKVLSDIAGWILEHKEELIALGKKVAEIAGGYIEAMATMARAVDSLVKSVKGSNAEHENSWKSLFDMILSVADKFGKDLTAKMKVNAAIFSVLTDAVERWVKDTKFQIDLIIAYFKSVVTGIREFGEQFLAPFKNALEWLERNVARFRAAFGAITNAGRTGLEVKSPPIVAQWLEMIGAAAIKSAATTASSAPKFTSSFNEISQSAKQHLPEVVRQWVSLGETIINIIAKIKNIKLDDIFGKVTSGVSTGASGAATGLLGKISGFIGGIANIFGGVEAIVKSFRSIFGIKSAFQKAMEAEQIAQARLQTQQMKLDIERTAQEVVQAAVASFQKALEFFDQLDAFTPARKAKFQQFFANLSRLMKHFLELAKSWSITSLAQAKAAAETVGPVVEAISALPNAFEAISGHFGVAQSAIDRFFADFTKVMDAFFERSEIWISGLSKRAMKVANRLNPVVELIAAFGATMKDLAAVQEPADEVFAIFDRVIDKIVTHVANLSLKFDKAVLKTMANFAEKAGAALSIWKEAIESIKATVDIQAPSETGIDNVVAGIEMFVKKLSEAVERLITTDLARIAAFANTIAPIAAAIKAWAETAEVVRGYTAIAAEVWDQIVADFERGLVLLNLLILDAQLYVEKATTFKTLIEQGTSLIDAALRSFGSGISAAASALSGGLPSGGSAIGEATAASNVGPLSAASRSTTAAPQTVVNVTQHVHGNVFAQSQLAQEVIRALEQGRQLGVISNSIFTGNLAPVR